MIKKKFHGLKVLKSYRVCSLTDSVRSKYQKILENNPLSGSVLRHTVLRQFLFWSPEDGDGLPTEVASTLHTLYGLWPSFPLFSLLPPFCLLGLLSKETTCAWDLVCKGRLRLRQDSVLLASSFVLHLWGFALGCYFVTLHTYRAWRWNTHITYHKCYMG